MKLFSRSKKIEEIEGREVEVAKTWQVRWKSRYGDYNADTQNECEVFLSLEDAEQFKKDLINAHKLLKNRNFIGVTLDEKNHD